MVQELLKYDATRFSGSVVPLFQHLDHSVVVFSSSGGSRNDILSLFALDRDPEIVQLVSRGQAVVFVHSVSELCPKVPSSFLVSSEPGKLHPWQADITPWGWCRSGDDGGVIDTGLRLPASAERELCKT